MITKKRLFTVLLSVFCWTAANSQQADSIVLHDAVLYYYSYGAGEPLVILSGEPGVAAHQEDDVAVELGKHYKAILFDQHGTGRSWTKPLDSTTINLRQAVEDLVNVSAGLRAMIINKLAQLKPPPRSPSEGGGSVSGKFLH